MFYNLLEENRDRLSPWFWWADEKVTPNKRKFVLFMFAYLIDIKRDKIAHKLNHKKLYDEPFIVYNEDAKIGGMCGLDNIDTAIKNDAEIWGFSFKGNTETIATVKILEDYCINTLNLTSIYGKVQSTNKASRYFWHRYGYDFRTIEKNVCISEHNPKFADIYTYTKKLTR